MHAAVRGETARLQPGRPGQVSVPRPCASGRPQAIGLNRINGLPTSDADDAAAT